MLDYPKPFRRTHSRKSKSQSVLPVGTELEPCHRRSGIRHFSHVPSIHCTETTTTTGQGRKFSNYFYRKQGRSVSGPMAWRDLIDQVAGVERMPSNPGERTRRIAEERRKIQELERIKGMREGLLTRVPPKGKGVMIVPDTNPRPNMPYPYPQHIPPAAAPQIGVFVPVPPPPAAVAADSCDNIMFIASRVAIAIVALFAWIFKAEVLRYGGTVGIAFLAWKLYEWNGQRKLQNRENEWIQHGRLLPAQPQQYVVHPVAPTGFVGGMPEAW